MLLKNNGKEDSSNPTNDESTQSQGEAISGYPNEPLATIGAIYYIFIVYSLHSSNFFLFNRRQDFETKAARLVLIDGQYC